MVLASEAGPIAHRRGSHWRPTGCVPTVPCRRPRERPQVPLDSISIRRHKKFSSHLEFFCLSLACIICRHYLPTTRMVNEPGTIAPRRVPVAHPRRRSGLRGNQQYMAGLSIQRERFRAAHGLQILFDGENCWAILFDDGQVPSPCELKASMVLGLNTAPSVPCPIGNVVMILPSVALSTPCSAEPGRWRTESDS